MRIPFTAPKLSELDALSPDVRAQVLQSYAHSSKATFLVRLVQASIAFALVFLLIAVNTSGSSCLLFGVAALASVSLGIIVYRFGAMRALRAILNSSGANT